MPFISIKGLEVTVRLNQTHDLIQLYFKVMDPLFMESIMAELVIRQQIKHQEEEDSRRGQQPLLLPPYLIRLIHQKSLHEQSLKTKKNEGSSQTFTVKNTISNKIFASKTPFRNLERTSIDQLFLEISAVGKYVIIRVLEKGYQIIGWNTVVEDDQGNVCGFSVYNYPPRELFSVGTVLIVKEPYFKIVSSGMPFIRCDCPTDIIVVTKSHELFQMAEKIKWKNELGDEIQDDLYALPLPVNATLWKDRGNALFNKKHLTMAREAYILGLRKCNESSPVFKLLHLNLIAVYLELECFETAVRMAERTLDKYKDEKKALYRAGKAFYRLRKYQDALKYFDKLCQGYPDEEELKAELKRCKRRVLEEETGNVSIDRLQRKTTTKPTMEIDCADYIGPVKIIKIPGKGRGVVLTRDVKRGTTLMISKAVASALDPSQSLGTQLNPNKMLDTDRNKIEIVSKIAQLITKNPNTFGPMVYDLSTGSSDLSEIVPLFCDPETGEEPICDVERIKAIYTCNSFAIDYLTSEGLFRHAGSGLFVLPSYMNHSCEPNVHRIFYNDIMIVTAAHNLEEGEELCTNYVAVTESYDERYKLLTARGFTCQCHRCQKKI